MSELLAIPGLDHPYSASRESGPDRTVISGPQVALSLSANFCWTLAGNVVYAGCQWGLLTAMAKLGSPEQVGCFALGLAITAPVFMLSNLQLRAVQATDSQRNVGFSNYLLLRSLTIVASLLAIGIVILIGGHRGVAAWVILGIGLAKAIESFSDLSYGLFQQNERMDWIAISMMAKGIVSLVALCLVLKWTGSLPLGIVALAVSWLVVLASYDIPRQLRLRRLFEERPHCNRSARGSEIRKLFILALPLGAAMMLISLATNIPRYFVEEYLGPRELGFFAAIAYLLVAVNTVVLAMGQSATPRLARDFTEGRHERFKMLLWKLSGLCLVGGILLIVVARSFGEIILSVLYTPEYAARSNVFALLSAVALLSGIASILGYGMTAARRFREQTVVFAFVILATAASSYLLVPRFGLLGAAWSCFISSLAQIVGSGVVLHVALRNPRADERVS